MPRPLERSAAQNHALPMSWLQRLRANLDEHVFFWIAMLITLYVFFFVPQVTNVWTQIPPWKGDVETWAGFVQRWAGYLVFLIFLIGFYGLSMFVVIRRLPNRWAQDRVEAIVGRRLQGWQQLGRRRFYRPLYWIAAVTWRAPDLCCRWLVWSVSNPTGRKGAPKFALGLLAAVLIGSIGLVLGAQSDPGDAYPLAGAFCRNMALLSLAAAIWLAVAIPGCWSGAARPGKIWLYAGRFLAWLIVTELVGEFFWRFAATNWWGNLLSYRLYTIWAVVQLLTTLVVLGLFIDRWHLATDTWPVRQIAILLLLVSVWLLTRSLPVNPSELSRHLTSDERQAWQELRETPTDEDTKKWEHWQDWSNHQWFAHLIRRVTNVDESEPVIIVAASGGGSRAAIFTALVLEALAQTPMRKDASTERQPAITNEPVGAKQHVWADNIVLISSVSGGSLATAYHITHWRPQKPPEQVSKSAYGNGRMPLNTSLFELKKWGRDSAGDLIQGYLDGAHEEFPEDLFVDYRNWRKEHSEPDREKAVKALKEAEPKLRARFDMVSKELKQADSALRNGPPPDAKALAQDMVKLRKKETLRTLLALHDACQSYDGLKPDLDRWIWTSRAFDEMCVDFMAPIMRGLLTPVLDRGDALLRFWEDRFKWSNCANFSTRGLAKAWNDDPERPAVVFNAVDVARGSRLAIGFPPLPSNLWKDVYGPGVTRESPQSFNIPVSLARAVRMSSNFPFGFRAIEFEATALRAQGAADPFKWLRDILWKPEDAPVHVLDGGVVDNTGLDTIYEMLAAVEYHADLEDGPYQVQAKELLSHLRRRGVCVLEIDAGAKPKTDLPHWLNPFGGITEQTQSLENGAYSNADRVKQLYLKEIRRILAQRLDDSGGPMTSGKTSLRDLEDNLPPTVLSHRFQCNHYEPGHRADPAIMTAWALGPRNKADVVARFLPELAIWEKLQEELLADIARSKAEVANARQEVAQARQLARLLDRVAPLNEEFQQISSGIAALETSSQAGRSPGRAELDQLQRRLAKAREQQTALAAEIGREKELGQAWTDLKNQVGEDEKLLAQLQKPRNADQAAKARAELNRKPDLAQQSNATFAKVRADLRAAESKVAKQATQWKQKTLFDPQLKYDLGNRQRKEVYEQQPTSRLAKPRL